MKSLFFAFTFHLFISSPFSCPHRWFHTESVHYLHSWSWMMKCLRKLFPSVISRWRKWKPLTITCHLAPMNQFLCVFLNSRSGDARRLSEQFWFSGRKNQNRINILQQWKHIFISLHSGSFLEVFRKFS